MPIVFGRFTLRNSPLSLERDGRRVPVAEAPLRMLARLLQSPGTVVTFEELARACGGESFRTASATLRTSMRLLRQALRDPASYPIFIETVRGYGYRFIAPVSSAGDSPSTGSGAEDPTPAPNLVQWVTDDNGAVEFATIWLLASVMVCLVMSEWWLLPLISAPAALRLGLRAATMRTLVREGVPPRQLSAAMAWADRHDQLPPRRHGWRASLHQLRSVALVVALAQIAALLLATWTRAWEAGPATQRAWSLVLSHPGLVFATAALLLVVDALATPRPVMGSLVSWARRTWRRTASHFLDGLPSPAPSGDPFMAEAEQELDAFLAHGLRQHRAT